MKQMLLRLFFCSEVMLFTMVYFVGPHGRQVFYHLKHENDKLEQELEQLEHDIVQLEQIISSWKTDSFYQEKMAREQLQMACADETVYYLT